MMTIKFVFTSLLALVLPGYGKADWITPTETEVFGVEGKAGDLFCHYGTSSSGYIDLYWFRQYPNQAPEFILYRGWGYSGKGDADFATKRFYSKATANSTNLYISSLVPADTALYYCALRGTKRRSHRRAVQKPQCKEEEEHSHTATLDVSFARNLKQMQEDGADCTKNSETDVS